MLCRPAQAATGSLCRMTMLMRAARALDGPVNLCLSIDKRSLLLQHCMRIH